MKILTLTFENINSLAGQWKIDFTNPDFDNAIFSITGETGSGKTSILDAICYAIYGQTPRQNSIASENEIMTKGKSSCFAEVVFETPQGKYAISTYQKRARDKADGNLQQKMRKLIDLVKNETIAEQIKKVDAAVPNIIGLDFKQFTQSIMLAQGAFSEFLKCDAGARADILEKLSDSQIYTQISKAADDKFNLHKKELDALETSIKVLTDVKDNEAILSLEDIEKNIESCRAERKQLENEKNITDDALHWLRQIQSLHIECDHLESIKQQIDERKIQLLPLLERLALARKAKPFLSLRDGIASIKDKENNAHKKHLDLESQHLASTQALEQSAAELKNAEENVLISEKKYQDQLEPISQMIAADSDIKNKTEACANAKRASQRAHDKKIEAQRTFDKMLATCEAKKADIEKTKAQLLSYHHAPELIKNKSYIASKLSELSKIQTTRDDLHKTCQTMTSQVAKLEKSAEKQKSNCDTVRNQLQICQKDIDDANLQYDTEADGQTIDDYIRQKENYLQKKQIFDAVNKYDSDRAELEQTLRPCPLCGAKHEYHDITYIASVKSDIQNILSHIQSLQNKIEHLEAHNKNIQKAQERYAKIEKDEKIATDHLKDIESDLREQKIRLETIQKSYDDAAHNYLSIQDEIQKTLAPYEFELSTLDNTNHIQTTIDAYCNHYEHLLDEQKRAESILNQNQLDCVTAKNDLENKENIDLEENEKYQSSVLCLNEMIAQRKNHYGDTDPNALQKQLFDDMQNDKQRKERIDQRYNHLKVVCEKQKSDRDANLKNIEMLEKERAEKESAFDEMMGENGFLTAQALESAIQDIPCIEAWETREKRLHDDEIENDGKWKATMEKLQSLKVEQKTDKDESTLELEKQDIENRINTVTSTIGGWKEKSDQIKKNQAQLEAYQTQYNEKKKNFEIWLQLNDLIGGPRLKKYVQSLTFKRLVSLANQYLNKFNNRYILVQKAIAETPESSPHTDDADTGNTPQGTGKTAKTHAKSSKSKAVKSENKLLNERLEFFIIDNDQGGIERPVSNLSGGETFLISLSLALGLSEMASKNIPIDSMFLDEGFGTLDEQTLSGVISTLSTLMQQHNKVVGVISHVEQIKAIDPHIEVRKSSNGHSLLSGPGVSRT